MGDKDYHPPLFDADTYRAECATLRAQLSEANAKLAVAVGALELAEKMHQTGILNMTPLEVARVHMRRQEAIATLPAQAAQMLAVVEAAREFRDNGTVLTSCSRGPCQRGIEHEDRSDPQAKLFKALNDFDANREAGHDGR